MAVSALHFYERQELITSRRTSGNQRRYRRDTLRRVALIRIAQRVGIPRADVAAALAKLRLLPASGPDPPVIPRPPPLQAHILELLTVDATRPR